MSDNLEWTAGQELPEQLRPYQEMVKQLLDVAESDEEAAFEIAAKVIDDIAVATTWEEVFAANEKGPKDAENILGQPIGVFDFRVWKSAEKFRKGTLGVYVVVDYIDAAGNTDMLSVGAANVVASLWRLKQLSPHPESGEGITGNKELPLWCMIVGRETLRGTLYTVAGAERPPF